MADNDQELKHHDEKPVPIKVEEGESAVEATDRGLFDFMGKKEKEEEKKPHQEGEAIATEFDQKVHVSEPEHKEEEKKHGGLLEKLHRSDSSSSSSVSFHVLSVKTSFNVTFNICLLYFFF